MRSHRGALPCALAASSILALGCDAVLGISGDPQVIDAVPDAGARKDASRDAPPRFADGGSECHIDKPIPAGALNPENACQSCQPDVTTSAWSDLIDGKVCATGVCHHGACANGCDIDGTYFVAGATNPSDLCEVCDPTKSMSKWATAADGATCGTAKICKQGGCTMGCEVDGGFYAANAPSSSQPCETCQPAKSTETLTSAAEGTDCGGGKICASGTCATPCTIAGTVYPAGTPNPSDPCQSCQPATSASAWTPTPDGVPCGAGEVCSTGQCKAGCYAGGAFEAPGAIDPADVCRACDPATSTTAWSPTNGAACGAGQVCNGAACVAGCFIAGTVYTSGTVDPMNACESCDASVSTTAWTAVQDDNGASCGTGLICNQATCEASCFIGGTFYPSGTGDPANGCESCQPSVSTSSWSDSDGLSCGSAKECSHGVCCPSGGVGCGTGCCGAGATCGDPATGLCCPAPGVGCGNTCCDGTCVDPAMGTCCAPGEVTCGTACCQSTQTCTNPATGTCS